MKRIISVISLLLIVCLAVFAMTACGSDEVTIGDNGNWFIGEEDTGVKASGTNATIGSNGNWYLDGTDTGKKAVGTDGAPAEKVTIGENGNWFIGDEDTGVKAVCGKYVVDVKTTTALDTVNGEPVAVTVITYSDGTTETIRNEIKERISSINLSSSAVYIKGYAPYLVLHVMTESYDNYEVRVTDDMYLMGKPDFNTAGSYDVAIVYGGQIAYSTITVVDVTDVTATSFSPSYNVRIGTDISELYMYVNFSNGTGYNVSLADATLSATPDLTKVGESSFDITYAGYTNGSYYINVYDPSVNNINHISTDVTTFEIPYNADAQTVENLIKANVIGRMAHAYLYEEMYDRTSIEFTITESMVDASAINTAMLGRQIIKLSVSIPGVGTITEPYSVSVVADLTGANLLKTYTNATTVGSMLGTINAYDNGIAELTGGQMGALQATYTLDGNKVTAVTSGMTLYFTVDNTEDTYEVYIPAGEPSDVYTSTMEMMKVCVYSDCVTIGMYQPAQGTTPEVHVPIYSMPTSSIDSNNQISISGMTITLNSDGTLTIIPQ